MVILCVFFHNVYISSWFNSRFYNLEISYNVECCTSSLSWILIIDTLKLDFVLRKKISNILIRLPMICVLVATTVLAISKARKEQYIFIGNKGGLGAKTEIRILKHDQERVCRPLPFFLELPILQVQLSFLNYLIPPMTLWNRNHIGQNFDVRNWDVERNLPIVTARKAGTVSRTGVREAQTQYRTAIWYSPGLSNCRSSTAPLETELNSKKFLLCPLKITKLIE